MDSTRSVCILGGIMFAGLIGLSCFIGLQNSHHILLLYSLVFLGLFLLNRKTKSLCGFLLFFCLANWFMFNAITYAPDRETIEKQKREMQQELDQQLKVIGERKTKQSGDN